MIPTTESTTQVSLAGALRQVFNQVLRTLEAPDPAALLEVGGPMEAALESWRKAIVAQTADHSIQKARRLEGTNLELRGMVAIQEKEIRDLRERNEALRDELVKLNKREETFKQQVFDAQFEAKKYKSEAKKLDLEVRDLRRRIRELEGGPPLTPSEAAPRATVHAKQPPAAPAKPEQASDASSASDVTNMRAAPSSARNAVEEAFRSMWKPPQRDETTTQPAAATSEPVVQEVVAAKAARAAGKQAAGKQAARK